MPTFAEIRKERKDALRQVRAAQSNLDSNVEKLERLLFRLRDRKTVLTTVDARRIADLYSPLVQSLKVLERFIADFYTVVAE